MSSHEHDLLNLIKQLDDTDSTRFPPESLLPVSEGLNNSDGSVIVERNKIKTEHPAVEPKVLSEINNRIGEFCGR